MKKLKYGLSVLAAAAIIFVTIYAHNGISRLDKLEQKDTHDLQRVRNVVKKYKDSIVRLYSARSRFPKKRSRRTFAIGKRAGRFFGTGWFIEKDLIVTNYHVVAMMQGVEIELPDGRIIGGNILVEDQKYDLALIDPDLPDDFSPQPMKVDRSRQKRYREIIHFGYPYDINYYAFGATLQKGSWGYRGMRMRIGKHPVWKAKLKTGPGASGSPVFNKKGEVIGVVEAIIRGSDISFFIPIRHIDKLYEKLDQRQMVKRIKDLDSKVNKLERKINQLNSENRQLKENLRKLREKLERKKQKSSLYPHAK